MQKQFLILLCSLFLSTALMAQGNRDILEDETIDNTTIGSENKERFRKPRKEFNADGVFVGMNFSLSIGNFLFLELSPYGGYWLNDYIAAGIGGTYIYSASLLGTSNVATDHIYGGRLFVNIRPFPELGGMAGVYLHLEGEYLNRQDGFTSTNRPRRSFIPAANLGIGYNTAFGKGFGFTTELLINALWFGQVAQGILPVYNTPWQYRIGVYYRF